MDYALIRLGVDSPTVDHPVIMTERLASPLHSRACVYHISQIFRIRSFDFSVTSELMFELYSVPSLTYAVDAVMSFYLNNRSTSPSTPLDASGLAISFNTASTSIIPILNGKGIMSQAKRCVIRLARSPDLELIQNYEEYSGDPSKHPNISSSLSNLNTRHS